jgi:hypothetical protein
MKRFSIMKLEEEEGKVRSRVEDLDAEVDINNVRETVRIQKFQPEWV